MKDKNVIVAIVISLGLIISSALIADGLKTLGSSIQGAGVGIGTGIANTSHGTSKPVQYEVSIKDGGNPFRIIAKTEK